MVSRECQCEVSEKRYAIVTVQASNPPREGTMNLPRQDRLALASIR